VAPREAGRPCALSRAAQANEGKEEDARWDPLEVLELPRNFRSCMKQMVHRFKTHERPERRDISLDQLPSFVREEASKNRSMKSSTVYTLRQHVQTTARHSTTTGSVDVKRKGPHQHGHQESQDGIGFPLHVHTSSSPPACSPYAAIYTTQPVSEQTIHATLSASMPHTSSGYSGRIFASRSACIET
jgi:hypothetical protein